MLRLIGSCLIIAVSAGASPARAEPPEPRSEWGSSSGLTDDERADVAAEFQKYLEKGSSELRNLSGSVHVAVDGKPLGAVANGFARRLGTQPATWLPIDADPRNPTLFPLASVTKAFTAALIWKRIAAGLITPSSRIADFVPFQNDPKRYRRAAAFWNQVTFAQLLNHTSGLNDHVDSPKWSEAISEDWTVEHIIEYVQLLPERRENAGHSIDHYSNAGYTVLGRALESPRMNGGSWRPLAQILQDEILRPMHLAHTGVMQTTQLDDRLFALPELGKDPNTVNYLRVPPMYFASGDMYSTAEDLDRWGVELFVKRQFIGDKVTGMWATPPSFPGGRTEGVSFHSVDSGRYHIVYKTGHLPSYANILAYIPEYGLTIAVLQNGNTIGPTRVGNGEGAVLASSLVMLKHAVELIDLVEAKHGRALP